MHSGWTPESPDGPFALPARGYSTFAQQGVPCPPRCALPAEGMARVLMQQLNRCVGTNFLVVAASRQIR